MELEAQKRLFAERYLRRPNDALMIVANILGSEVIDNPILAISYAESWPNDPFVLAELERIKSILPSMADIAREIHEKAREAFQRGCEKDYFAGMRLYAEITGHLKKGTSDDGKSDDKLRELASMILDIEDNGEVL